MKKIAFVKRAVIAVGFVLVCGGPRPILGQAGQSAATPSPGPVQSSQAAPILPPGVRPAPDRRTTYISPNEFLAGLTLTDDQKAKINQIREDTKASLAAVARDEKLGPEVKEAMLGGYQRIENGKIFVVLTPAQQVEVRKRLATLRAAAQPQHPLERPSPEKTPEPK